MAHSADKAAITDSFFALVITLGLHMRLDKERFTSMIGESLMAELLEAPSTCQRPWLLTAGVENICQPRDLALRRA